MKRHKKALLLSGSFFLITLVSANAFGANIYVDGQAVEEGATWDGVDGHSYTCPHGTGTGYSTIQAAANAIHSGDDVYIRGGTYVEHATLDSSMNGTPDNYTSFQSYPGEWAIIDANRGERYALGHNNYDKIRGSSMLEYMKFERLELTGGYMAGLFLTGGPFLIRYCYIHDNLEGGDCGSNPCGIKGMIWKDSIVEYCYFKNNGCSSSANEMHSAVGMQIHTDYIANPPDVGPANIVNAYQNNIYRYNLFEDTENRALSGIHDKSQQQLSPIDQIDWTYKEYGNKIHHNMFFGVERAIGSQQGFVQIYNNITWGGGIQIADSGSTRSHQATMVYNNTVHQQRLISNFGNYQAPLTPTPYQYWYNNIIDNAPSDEDWMYDITIGTWSMHDPYPYDRSHVDVTNNYIYNPSNDVIFRVAREGLMSVSTFNTTYMKNNYQKASSEGSDNLYSGTSGADQYITRGSHSLATGKTIIDSGVGRAHPYLTGITIPSYVGATNPDDNAWVAGVLSLRNISIMKNATSEDPGWIEGGEGGGGSLPVLPQVPVGFRKEL